MQKRTFRYSAFKYDELGEEAKLKAISELWDINVTYEWWDGDIWLELTADELKSRRFLQGEYPGYSGLFKWKQMYFDIDRRAYVQYVDLNVTDENAFRKFLRIPKPLWENCYYSFENSREYNTKLVIEPNDCLFEFTDRQQEIIDRAVEIFSDKVHESWVNLRDTYEDNTSRKAIEETIHANDYNFFEDGSFTRMIAA